MRSDQPSTRLWSCLHRLEMPQIRAFHMSWLALFLCFFAWFGVAPLMNVIRQELALTQSQIGWLVIASVSATVVARLAVGWFCDRVGPRLTYSGLLILGSLGVMGVGLAHDFQTFLLFRLLIGTIGASFVITQYHTSVMFAPNVVGVANATSSGWGNLGGGVTQLAMPVLFALLVGGLGLSQQAGWRVAMMIAGAVCMLTGVAYYFFTQDTPQGNFRELRAEGKMSNGNRTTGAFIDACKDHRVWALFLIYGCCFGVELTLCNVAAMYFADYFQLGLFWAGAAASLFGLMNIFARSLGGYMGDTLGSRRGLRGRVFWLFITLFCEGLALMLFSQMSLLPLAIAALVLFSLFVQMSEGATFAVVPFINKKSLGAVAGLVGAGGNAGAVAAGFLFKGALPWPTALLILGAAVTLCSFCALAVRFSPSAETEAQQQIQAALTRQQQELQPALGT